MTNEMDLEVALAHLTGRLIDQFCHELPQDVIEATVRASAEPFRDARVLDFLPVLIERSCMIRLRALADRAATVPLVLNENDGQRRCHDDRGVPSPGRAAVA